MYIISERESIKAAIKNFINTHGMGTYGADYRGIRVGYELSKLDEETCTAEEVNNLMGKDWTSHVCSDCGKTVKEVICVGERLDYESYTAYLCKDCLSKAYELFIKG